MSETIYNSITNPTPSEKEAALSAVDHTRVPDRSRDPGDADLVELVSRLSPEAFDRLGGAMESAVQQVRGRKTIRVAGQGMQAQSPYAAPLHSFASMLQAELNDVLE